MTDTFATLSEEFLHLADMGDEAAARKFLTDHIMEFPEEVREKIVFAFFEEALAEKATAERAVAAVQQEGIAALRSIIASEKEMGHADTVEELKRKLGA